MQTCPNCGAAEASVFYEVNHVPVHSVLLLESRDEALNFATGNVELAFCNSCGFIFNTQFDTTLHEYAARYEATQSYSPTFNAFAYRLAQDLIARHDLHGKDIIEIGCGQGEFLIQLCELGDNCGVGFDPAYRDDPFESTAKERLQFIADFYSEKYQDYRADFICCKMTMEHIDQTASFIAQLRRSIGDRLDTAVYFQLPNGTYVLRDVAFWDVYYEHCSYFTPVSLAYLFQHHGFDILSIYTDYDDQYLMIESRPSSEPVGRPFALDYTLEDARRDVAHFTANYPRSIEFWREILQDIRDRGERAVIWGGGSKGVAFLTTLGIHDQIEYVVDINPRKHNMYMAGTGQRIVGPEFLKSYQPDAVVVMNPIYCDEIQQTLNELDVNARLLPISLDTASKVMV